MHFGSGGWRGVLGEDFTLSGVRAALHGLAGWLSEQDASGPVVVAHDTRFLSPRLAEIAADLLGSHGLRCETSRVAVPTPVACHAVVRCGASAGVVFTASHNPPEYHGIKLLGPRGEPLEPAACARIEALARDVGAAATEPAEPPASGERGPGPARRDFNGPYVAAALEQLDREGLAAGRFEVIYDAMHGVGVRALDPLLRRAGVPLRVRRSRPDPLFGGGAPDPLPERLGALARAVRAGGGARLGLATDGDADRFGVMDSDGRLLRESEAVALLVDHLARSGRIGRGVAISAATGSLVARVAGEYGLPVLRLPMGFGPLARALADGRADAAGDESGGFALAALGCNKDGVLAAALLAEIAATAGLPLRGRLAELESRLGRWVCGRSRVPASPRRRERLAKLSAGPPARFDGCRVREALPDGGLHLVLEDGFLLLRASGTEPVLRVYAEARSEAALEARLAAGLALLEG